MQADIFITGMSNTDAIAMALKTYKGSLKFDLVRINPKIDSEVFVGEQPNIEFFRPRFQVKLAVLALWGNWYNSVGIAEHPEKFDFIYPGFDEDVDESRRIIPFQQIKRNVNNNVRYRLDAARILRPLASGKVLMMEPPPPNDDEHIHQFPSTFREPIEASGLTPAPIRRKLWKLQSQVYADVAKELDMDFFPFLPEATSPDGFIAPEYRYRDPTHANALYGHKVIERLEQIHGALS
ncbi:hypothetical protein [Rhizobium sp. Leaf341]|uniref:hypothetical protein n=1 Tax=Rhizobium sp. Leaf341 TaxID=1736344 RepID=UPI0007140269|nr:hypothetical protein [Rhizobium sp. Leaf341]KQR77651.1 hypothetical protein ASG03_14720 [Rhizobium sp. Leaf341]